MQSTSVFQRAPWLRPLVLMLGLAASVAAGVAVVLWARTPEFAVLYSELATSDAAEVAQALQRRGIDYRIEPATGQLQVPMSYVHEARMQLAGEGLPRGSAAGFNVLNEDPGLGVSEFMEGARYQHALENELVRTVTSLRSVQGARVHLVMPKNSAFLRDRQRASASVVLNLYPGRDMNSAQVSAITHLVAAAVPGLDVADVAVVDSTGRLLSQVPGQQDSGMPTQTQFELQRRYEDTLREKIEMLLLPMLGPSGSRASVSAELDFSVREQTRESYDPARSVVRAEQTAELKEPPVETSGGIPGALSNTPPQAAESVPLEAGDGTTESAAQTPEPVTLSSNVTRNYEVDRTISHERMPVGSVERLSVAVLVNDMRSVDERGRVTTTPLTEVQLTRITQLVKDAVGFNAARGDSVNVMNASFQAPGPVADAEEAPFWARPEVQAISKQLLGGLIALIVLFGFIRPLMKGALQAPVFPSRSLLEDDADLAAVGRTTQSLGGPAPPGNYEERVGRARALIAQDPKRAAQVVRGWVGTDG